MTKRAFMLGVVAFACSRSELDGPPSGPWPPPKLASSPTCVASFSAVKACSQLRVVTPKQPLALDPAFVDQESAELLGARGGGLEIVDGAGDLVHLDLGGSPPTLTVGATTHLLPNGHLGIWGAASDGHLLYFCAERENGLPVNDELVFDENNELITSFAVPDSIESYCMIGARNGLALTAYEGWNQTSSSAPIFPGAVALADATGIVWSRGGLGDPFAATSYGCGFAYLAPSNGDWSPPSTLTMLPLDGSAEISSSPIADVGWALLYAWPYDARTVALVTRSGTDTNPADSCPIFIDLFRDDGSSTSRTIAHDCGFPIATVGDVSVSFTMASFGAVLHDGAGNFQLLDAHAQPVGAPVSVPLIPYISDVVVAATGDYVVVLTAEDDQRAGNVIVSQTVLGCD